VRRKARFGEMTIACRVSIGEHLRKPRCTYKLRG